MWRVEVGDVRDQGRRQARPGDQCGWARSFLKDYCEGAGWGKSWADKVESPSCHVLVGGVSWAWEPSVPVVAGLFQHLLVIHHECTCPPYNQNS